MINQDQKTHEETQPGHNHITAPALAKPLAQAPMEPAPETRQTAWPEPSPLCLFGSPTGRVWHACVYMLCAQVCDMHVCICCVYKWVACMCVDVVCTSVWHACVYMFGALCVYMCVHACYACVYMLCVQVCGVHVCICYMYTCVHVV